MKLFKISATSNVTRVAGAIALSLKEDGQLDIQAIGANAINQMVKSIAIARGQLSPNGFDLVCVPSFIIINFDEGIERTAIKFEVKLTKL